jgi:cyclophilin family peptidyl-prolyl cis-trans isomerase|tara:strand:+ start:304 stop:1392 length:1089 start_codon:yes stop_codon:yes gene_type:complete
VPIPAELQKSWDDAIQLLGEKKDPEGALEALRSAWGSIENEAQRAKTLSLAADAGTELGITDKRNQKSHWQKAYKNYNKSLSIDSKNKETRRNMNKLASMMDEQSISLGLGFQMFDQGNPTPLGLLAMVLSMAAFLVSIKLVSEYLGDDSNPIVSLEVQYVLNGQSVTGEIQIELYEDEAPMHVESFLTHAENFQYDGGQFHRVIEGFMVQGGDIQNMGGSGGYAAHYYGYCNGEPMPESECRQKEDYTVPFEHENGLKHTAGAIAAAHAGKNTDGSQFYIVPSDGFAEFLDYDEFPAKDCWGDLTPTDSSDDGSCHTVFGYVTSGMEHVDGISQVDTVNPDARPSDDRPVDPVRIISVTVV